MTDFVKTLSPEDYPDPGPDDNLYEMCLLYLEQIFAQYGWYQGTYNKDRLDLGAALHKLSVRFARLTKDDPSNGEIYKFRDEIEAIICYRVHMQEWPYISGFNDRIATCYADIAEVLQLAREGYRPEMAPYRQYVPAYTPVYNPPGVVNHPGYNYNVEGYGDGYC